MNVLGFYHGLKRRGVRLEADGGSLFVDAPAGSLSEQDRAALAEAKPVLLKMLTPRADEEPEDDGRRFGARPSRYPGYTSLCDPIEGVWHDYPTKDCYPSIVELANKSGKGGRSMSVYDPRSIKRQRRTQAELECLDRAALDGVLGPTSALVGSRTV